MQEALQKVGFYSGEEDMEFSSFSRGTERAVKTWQYVWTEIKYQFIGLDRCPESGIMTSELLERLFTEPKEAASSFKESANVAVIAAKTEISKVQQEVVKESGSNSEVSEHQVFLLGENRWEDSSRLIHNSGKQVGQSNSRGTTKCLSCRGEGRLLCTECDGTGEPNIEPQLLENLDLYARCLVHFIEWVDEEMKCPYCEGLGYTVCDVCEGKAVTSA